MRLEVAVIERDGSARIVNAARPATLVAFADQWEKQMPESVREVSWVVHHALGIEQDLDEWLAGLEDLSALPEDVALARRIIDGDEEARQIVLGELPNPQQGEVMAEGTERPIDPALAQLDGTAAPEAVPEPATSGARA